MKYLLSEAHGIGDCILILPVAKAIKAFDKKAYIRVITSSNAKKIQINRDIFSLQDYVDDIQYYSSNEKLHSIWFLLKNLFKRFDIGISIQDFDTPNTSLYPSRILRLCANHTCGTKIKSNPRIRYDMYIDREEGVKRDEYFRRALNKLGLCVPNDNTGLLNLDKVEAHCPYIELDNNKKTVALVLGTAPVTLRTENGIKTNNAKSWPYQYWLDLAGMLSASYNVILLGGPSEAEDLKKYKIPSGRFVFDFIGRTKIKESIALLEKADIVVGADTGLMHCAGALEKTTLTLFGCTDAHEYLPFGKKSEYIQSSINCSPCFGTKKSVTCKYKRCMLQITVETVFTRVLQLIE